MDSGQIGARMRQHRIQAGLTQQELADRAGVNIMMVNRYERGHILPSVENLLAIAAALGVSVDYLVAGDDAGGGDREIADRRRQTAETEGSTNPRLDRGLFLRRPRVGRFARFCRGAGLFTPADW